MSALQQGFYTLQQGPALGLGGMYVTGGGVNQPIFTGAQVPTLAATQTWSVTPVSDKPDMYTIVLSGVSNSTAGFGTPKAKIMHNAPVVLAEQPQSWRIVKSKTAPASVSDAYEIHAPKCGGCADLIVNVPDVGNELKLVTLNTVKDNMPYFKFYKRSD